MGLHSGNLAIDSSRISAFTIPTDRPESDGTAQWDSTTVVIVELIADGTTGLGYTYTDAAAASIAKALIEREILKHNPLDIPAMHLALDRQVRNWGRPGLVSNAISAIDTALWDLKARVLGQPMSSLIGKVRNEIPGYGSGGFTSYTETELVDQLTQWAAEGFRCVKMKIGREPDRDLARVIAVQKALQGKAELYVDANGAYSRQQALEKAHKLGDQGVRWFEEPVTSDDRTGLRYIVQRSPELMKIAAGEYIYVLNDARLMIEGEAVHVLQTDVTRCGGISNFIKIGHLCETYHLPYSAHTAPSIHATLCCCILPAINVEYFHDHVRIENMIFDGAVQPRNGVLKPDLSRVGLGLEIKHQDVASFRVFSAELHRAD